MTVIALVDCDSFFVACEQAYNPSLCEKPVCVLSNNDGCVISRSREAKKMGVRMGQPHFMAKKEFPDAIYISGHHELYSEISERVMGVLRDYSPDVEVYSVDEAFVDLTGLKRLYKKNYLEMAQDIRKQVKEQAGVDVSIGLSSSKTLAKLAGDKAKRICGGIYMIGSRKIDKELKNTPVEEIWGVGKNTGALLNKWGILNAYELICQTDTWLKTKIGKRGVELKHELMGENISPVISKTDLPKSIQKTSSFGKFTSDANYIKNSLNYHIHRACVKLRRINGRCSTVSLMLRTKDFQVYHEKRVLLQATNFEFEISEIIFELFNKIYSPNIIYRSSGIVLDGLVFGEQKQMFLFADDTQDNKKEKLTQCIDNIEKKFGRDMIQTGYY